MSILSQASNGIKKEGQRIIIAGPEKMGKTTLCCNAPEPLLIPLEIGYSSFGVNKLPMIETWEEVEQLCIELIEGCKNGKIKRGSSIIWDSATALERLIDAHTLKTDPKNTGIMAEAHGGYGKAYDVSNETFKRWLRYQDDLARHGGINIIVTCHVFSSQVLDPAHGEYNSWDLQLHSPKNEKTYGKREHITQWADMIGYLHEPMFVNKAKDGEKLNKAIPSNQGRMLAVERKPQWVAGNRYGIKDLIPIPAPPQGSNGFFPDMWNAIAHAIHSNCGIDVFNRSK